MTSSPHRLPVLDALRGIAALAVCWYHFTHGNETFLPSGLLKSSGTFGWLGVEMFFVISGFIIPYALHRSSYQTADYGRFILKRIIRLDPPYLVGLLIVIVLGYASAATPGYRGGPFEPSFTQIALHLGYANVFFGYPWLNPAYWTLAIELQYYLLVGLLFSAVAHRALWVRASAFSFMACLAVLFPAGEHLCHWLFLFMLGMAAFQLRSGIIERAQFLGWIILLGAGAWHVGGPAIAITGIVTTLLLGLPDASVKPPLLFFGHISYSLYLLHVPIGGRIINLSLHFLHDTPGKVAALALAMAASVASAWLLYRYVELPAQQWSSSIRYRKKSSMRPVNALSQQPPAPAEIS